MRKSTPLWILAFDVFVSFLVVSYSVVQVVADEVGNSEGISIDCGVTHPTWDKNKFYYQADDQSVVESGQIHNVSSEYTFDSEDEEQVSQQLNTLRSFPQGKRNCYSLQPKQGRNNNYLVRAFYSYGNYDNKSYVPHFELHLGVNLWTNIYLEANGAYERAEVITDSPTDKIDVCLINTGHGIPFISLLELWPLCNSIYRTHSNSLPLGLMGRSSLGTTANYGFVRYADDIYGRSWFLKREIGNSEPMSTSVAIKSDRTDYQLPTEVLSTAIRPRNGSSSLVIILVDGTNNDTNYEYYIYLHFFDFEERSDQDQPRKMKITFTDTIQDSITLRYKVLQTMVKTIPKGQNLNNITITSTPDSGLPPMINALEIYRVLPQPNSATHEADAMWIVKHAYNITRNWQGDPCRPSSYRWEGLTCNYLHNIPRITSLNLSSSKLTGEINSSFSDLISLESLDLSDNQLMGEIPEVLAKLSNLKLLNLSGNNLTGSIPKALWEKNGTSLILSLDGNPGLCQTGSCKTIKKKFIKSLVASVASLVVLAIIVTISLILCKMKRKHHSDKKALLSKKNDQLKSKNHEFSQIEVHGITNDFATEIGGGGFGKVYLGRLKDGTQVAVKLLSQSSQQGLNEFQSEAKLLSLIYHRNLVSLVGYCDDGDMRALIYEYMANGNLHHLLSDKNPNILKWNERLQIALDTACGLDYLHNGCKPPIIHRDIKSSNILLSESMQAKIADLGLSKAFANDTDTHISTRPAGTFGYLDPEFHRSGHLNKKSDVYSFGIVLLELITGQRAITETSDEEGKRHISDWVNPKLEIGNIQAIADPRLEGKFSSASAWKFLEIAMPCITPTAIQRPDISSVAIHLRQCLAMETSLHESGEGTALETNHSQSGSYSPLSAR